MSTEEFVLKLDRLLPALLSHIAHRTRVPGLGPAAMMVLRRLMHSGSCTVSELAEWMGVTSATVTGITNKLASQHLINRWREENDRRVVRIEVTGEGTRLLGEVERLRRAKMTDVLSHLSMSDLQALTDILEKLTQQTVGTT